MTEEARTTSDASEDLPEEFEIPTRMVVDAETWTGVVDEIENPTEPTPALRELVSRRKHTPPDSSHNPPK